jgi:hypothetical protein
MSRVGVWLLLCLPGVVSMPLAAAPRAPECDRACLLRIAGLYMDSLSANDASGAPFAPTLRSTENGQPSTMSSGIWGSARGWRYRHCFVDPVSGQIGAFGVISEGPDQDVIIGLRLKVVARQISESELLVTRKGEFPLFAPRAQTEPQAAFTTILPSDHRATRAALAETPQHYFQAIREGNPELVPIHPDANRVENGVQTTNNPDFPASASVNEGLKRLIYMQQARALRVPVIDVDRGLAFAVVAVDMPEMTRTLTIRGKPVEINPQRQHLPRTLLLFELFHVEDGQIRQIEAVMRNMPLGAQVGWPGDDKPASRP